APGRRPRRGAPPRFGGAGPRPPPPGGRPAPRRPFSPPRRVAGVAARRSTALRLTRTSAIQSRSRGMPGLWGSFRAAAPGVGPSAGDAAGAWPGPPSAVLSVFADFAALAVFAAAAPDGPAV